jgi:hypothetical protein
MMFLHAIVAIIAGIAAHQTDPLIEGLHTDSATLKLLARYGTGVLGNWPMFDLFLRFLGLDEAARQLANIGYIISFIFFGIGVFTGRVVRSVSN